MNTMKLYRVRDESLEVMKLEICQPGFTAIEHCKLPHRAGAIKIGRSLGFKPKNELSRREQRLPQITVVRKG